MISALETRDINHLLPRLLYLVPIMEVPAIPRVFVVGKRRPSVWEVGAEETLITLICANSGSVTGNRGQPQRLGNSSS